jgi:cytochrome oxidase Cu insertion factor (SCO1/SenC/PrrC family)
MHPQLRVPDFDLRRRTLLHELATALVSPNGKIVKIWRGNAWTPDEIIQEIRAQNF